MHAHLVMVWSDPIYCMVVRPYLSNHSTDLQASAPRSVCLRSCCSVKFHLTVFQKALILIIGMSLVTRNYSQNPGLNYMPPLQSLAGVFALLTVVSAMYLVQHSALSAKKSSAFTNFLLQSVNWRWPLTSYFSPVFCSTSSILVGSIHWFQDLNNSFQNSL